MNTATRVAVSSPPRDALRRRGARRVVFPALVLLVFVTALATRLAMVIRSGGFRGNFGYDAGVYYAAADALIHGRLPYRDFVLLHPPGAMLALVPSALLGRLTTDHIGFASANLGFSIIGAVNAVLVVVVCRRFGIGRTSALIGGFFYALWFSSAAAEYLARLEPLGNLFLLIGLLALAPAVRGAGAGAGAGAGDPGRATAPRWGMLGAAGLAFGAAASVKIWFVAPLGIVAVWLLITRRSGRPALVLLAGAAGAGLLIDLPFLLLSRGAMWSRVVSDQLGRARAVSTSTRLAQLISLDRVGRHVGGAVSPVAVVVVAALFGLLLALAWQRSSARLFVVLALAQLAILLLAPSWFGFYADFAAVPLSITAAAAAAALPRPARVVGWLPVAGAAALTVTVLIAGTFHATTSWHGAARLITAASGVRCVMSDTPGALIELNTLDRDLSNGCPNWIDVTGRTYFGRDAAAVPRPDNAPWQRDLRRYLLSGQAVFIARSAGDGLTAATLHAIDAYGVLATDGYSRLYRTATTAPAQPPVRTT